MDFSKLSREIRRKMGIGEIMKGSDLIEVIVGGNLKIEGHYNILMIDPNLRNPVPIFRVVH